MRRVSLCISLSVYTPCFRMIMSFSDITNTILVCLSKLYGPGRTIFRVARVAHGRYLDIDLQDSILSTTKIHSAERQAYAFAASEAATLILAATSCRVAIGPVTPSFPACCDIRGLSALEQMKTHNRLQLNYCSPAALTLGKRLLPKTCLAQRHRVSPKVSGIQKA